MSQYGYRYGYPQRFPPSQTYPYQPQQPFPLPTYLQNENSSIQENVHGTMAQQSYDYNRNAIPGLGLNFSTNNMNWQHEAVPNPVPLPGITQPVMSQGPTKQERPHAAETSVKEKSVQIDDGDEMMEEGEVNEGEVEDLYGYEEKDNPAGRHIPASKELSVSGQQEKANDNPPAGQRTQKEPPTQHRRDADVTRERSGSYSPYLSPREIQSTRPTSVVLENHDPRESIRSEQEVPDLRREKLKSPQQPGLVNQPSADPTVIDARNRAKKALLKLWPLNIRYSHYIDEGIDKAILDDLFNELGLDPALTSRSENVTSPTSQAAPNLGDQTSRITPQDITPSNNLTEKDTMVKDKSEERKDRIARLLAAKGSKSSAPTQDASTKPATAILASTRDHNDTVSHETGQGRDKVLPSTLPSTLPPRPPTAIIPNRPVPAAVPEKKQSAKSKLLQQKMEALKKAREAMAKKSAQGQAVPASGTPPTLLDVSATSGNRDTSIPAVADPSQATVAEISKPRAASERADASGALSIPGLFLSSTPQPPSTLSQRKRPVAVDLNESSSATVSKRPFGQIRDSRPFLIDVSDDDDDAEMDIDSPEQRSSSIHRPITPAMKTASFRDRPASSQDVSFQQTSSPRAAATPTGLGTGSNGLYDLQSMNRKIEDMKRKIAEAEARKKTKQPSSGSTSVPQSQQQSKEGSVDPPTNTSSPDLRPPLARAGTNTDQISSTLAIESPPQLTLEHSKVRKQSPLIRPRALVRSASERLPVVEARRREQLAQLRHLQSEVARVEKEIQDSLEEENKLREAVDVSETSQELADSPAGSESASLSGEYHARLASSPPTFTKADSSTVTGPNAKMGIEHAPPSISRASAQSPAQSSAHEIVDIQDLSSQAIDTANSQSRPLQSPDTNEPLISRSDSTDGQVNGISDAKISDNSSAADEDIIMGESDLPENNDDTVASSDKYEPPEMEIKTAPQPAGESESSSTPALANEGAILETLDCEVHGISETVPITQPISTAKAESMPLGSDFDREEAIPQAQSPSEDQGSIFVPYESPLQYFRAYRFHPRFQDTISGGLRSLTYSNKIDLQREVCPDQQVGDTCPRGSSCEFQHFEHMEAPDDQILVQLGAYGNYEEDQRQRYITGLRELLTDFRNRKIKDFQTISQSIIEYRARFHGDTTKILPLGSVSI